MGGVLCVHLSSLLPKIQLQGAEGVDRSYLAGHGGGGRPKVRVVEARFRHPVGKERGGVMGVTGCCTDPTPTRLTLPPTHLRPLRIKKQPPGSERGQGAGGEQAGPGNPPSWKCRAMPEDLEVPETAASAQGGDLGVCDIWVCDPPTLFKPRRYPRGSAGITSRVTEVEWSGGERDGGTLNPTLTPAEPPPPPCKK